MPDHPENPFQAASIVVDDGAVLALARTRVGEGVYGWGLTEASAEFEEDPLRVDVVSAARLAGENADTVLNETLRELQRFIGLAEVLAESPPAAAAEVVGLWAEVQAFFAQSAAAAEVARLDVYPSRLIDLLGALDEGEGRDVGLRVRGHAGAKHQLETVTSVIQELGRSAHTEVAFFAGGSAADRGTHIHLVHTPGEGFQVNVLAGSEGSGSVFTEDQWCRLDDLGLVEEEAGPDLTPAFVAEVSDDIDEISQLVLDILSEIHDVSPNEDLLVDLRTQPTGDQ